MHLDTITMKTDRWISGTDCLCEYLPRTHVNGVKGADVNGVADRVPPPSGWRLRRKNSQRSGTVIPWNRKSRSDRWKKLLIVKEKWKHMKPSQQFKII